MLFVGTKRKKKKKMTMTKVDSCDHFVRTCAWAWMLLLFVDVTVAVVVVIFWGRVRGLKWKQK